MMKPIFTTNVNHDKNRKAEKVQTPLATQPTDQESSRPTGRPDVSPGRRVTAKLAHRLILGAESWVGTSAAMVKKSSAHESMLDPGYGSSCYEKLTVDGDRVVQDIIDDCLVGNVVKFTRISTATAHVDGAISSSVAIYKSQDGSREAVIDKDLDPPDVLWSCRTDKFVDAHSPEAVTYLVAAMVGEDDK